MSTPLAACSFDDIVIDFAGHRLLRGGVEQPLEPKAFAVLALLAGEPGRVFTRDEILDAVWGHRHVTPGVLNRAMTLQRQALGEDAQHPRLLQTVHGVGYRFDLPPPAAIDEAKPVLENLAATAGGDPPVPAPAAISPAPAVSTRRLRIALFWLLALVGIGAAGAWWSKHESSLPPVAPIPSPVPAPSATPTLVVMPLKPIGSGDGVQAIADGLSEELICSLARIDGLRIIARESTRLLGNESDPARVRQLGITHALEGNLQQAGQQLRIRLRMVQADTGSLLWARDFDGKASEVLTLQRDIAEAVAASLTLKLGLTMPTAQGGDAEFLRRYLRARSLTMRFDLPPDESVEAAEKEFRALLRERPDDARTRAWLAVALRIRAHRRPELSRTLAEEAVREARLASRLDPSRYEPYQVLAANDCRNNRWEACMAQLTRARTLAPGLAYLHIDQAAATAQLGYLDRAEAHAREGLALDPINPDAHYMLARILDTRGKHEEAARHYQHSAPAAVHGRWFNAIWREDAVAALRLANEFGGSDGSDSNDARLKPSAVAVSRALADPGQWPQALVDMQLYERDASGRMNFARVFLPGAASQADTLVAQLAAARADYSSSFDLLLWTQDLGFLRRTPAFQAYLRDNGILAYWKQHGFPEQCRPQGDGAACD